MHSFVDNSRRTWEVAINVSAVKRIRGLLGIDLYALVDDGFKSLSKLVSDPVTLADVLYCLCKDQADSFTACVRIRKHVRKLTVIYVTNPIQKLLIMSFIS
jgi:hypothetical protein